MFKNQTKQSTIFYWLSSSQDVSLDSKSNVAFWTFIKLFCPRAFNKQIDLDLGVENDDVVFTDQRFK